MGSHNDLLNDYVSFAAWQHSFPEPACSLCNDTPADPHNTSRDGKGREPHVQQPISSIDCWLACYLWLQKHQTHDVMLGDDYIYVDRH